MRYVLVSVCFVFCSMSAWAQTDDQGIRVIIGAQAPLYLKCYENARDGVTDENVLEPCNLSLETETLTQRKTAILYANRGVINFNLGEYTAAVGDFTASLDSGIHVRGRIFANRGLSYEAMNYEALARADYQAALAINPKNAFAARRLEELAKPIYDRTLPPKKITAEAPKPAAEI